ncbi:Aste57867_17985 [Aphanomyces stellatus]|uniref:Aste57867_17985 protein n=1 Tax=Aphanomyces stellatus TaxID=120398 RepID=A0A485LCJ3_9STRA|nr:hypothetical protein As57867_017923 [Aphanomyces stellatus]VFT94724.1 Aste57867_17985 [Aphanomyces stellatus]
MEDILSKSSSETESTLADAQEPQDVPATGEEESSDDEDDDILMERWTCQTIRGKIQKFLATKIMTQTAFLKEIGANSNSFQRFMKYKGVFQGSDNSTYSGSLCFFSGLEKKQKKEKAAAKIAAKTSGTKRKAATASADGEDTPAEKKKKLAGQIEEIEAVELPEDLKVFDDCDVVRDHIQSFFLTKVMPQAAFAAHLNVSLAALRKFLARKGKREGVGIVYKAAYFFFEKKRVFENAPKSNKRKKIEATMPNGYPLERDPTQFLFHVSDTEHKVKFDWER